MWVFGYASLVWKTGFDFDERITEFIKGYRRAFHLGELHYYFTLFIAFVMHSLIGWLARMSTSLCCMCVCE